MVQENNECLTKSNDELVKRIVQEKEKYMEQIFKMNENEARLNQKIEMLLCNSWIRHRRASQQNKTISLAISSAG